jgi:predicted DNA-binding transcriptional regulator AlpA
MAHSASALQREVPSLSASNPITGYVPERELAAQLQISLRTLRRWQSLRIGPAVTKIGRKILYSHSAIETWLRARTAKPCRTRSRRGAR